MLKNFEKDGLEYLSSDNGKVYNLKGVEIKQRLNADGYPVVTLGKKSNRRSIGVHRIIATLFVENPGNKLEVNHIDGNKQNNDASNLEWVTRSEQMLHAHRTGLKSEAGELNGRHILKEEDVRDIRNLLGQGRTVYSIAKQYGRGWQTINHIAKGTTWKNII